MQGRSKSNQHVPDQGELPVMTSSLIVRPMIFSCQSLSLGLCLAAMLMLGACDKERAAPTATTNTQTSTGVETDGVSKFKPGSVQEFVVNVGDRIYFDTDQSTLSSEAQAVLQRQAAWLKQWGQYRVLIEGHCDERGTREYNLALGDRRANAARDYLVSLGISSDRIRNVSYGKERPVELCSEEICWAKNRRAVTVVEGSPTS
jgi:peptidoglycan-associated lipoprotein